jgi:hypothetical protein
MSPRLLHVHGIAEIRQNLLRAPLAAFVFIRAASFAPYQLTVFECHAASANPVFPVADVDMIELCHAFILMGTVCRVAEGAPPLLE